MDTNLLIRNIDDCIEGAINRRSKLSAEAINVPMLGSLQIRHLLNNLGSISTICCDHGSHRGASYCSMVYQNPNLKIAIAIDSWASDHMQGEQAEKDFRMNANLFTHPATKQLIVKSDSFEVDLSVLPDNIDFYYFDGSHDALSQCRALTYYISKMADTFIFCVDDYMLDEVKEGTARGLLEAGVEVLYEKELVTDHEYDNESWWRGWKVFLLKKATHNGDSNTI